MEYEAIRKYYQDKMGTTLPLNDMDMTIAIRSAPDKALDELVAWLNTWEPVQFPIKYDPFAFTAIKWINSESLHGLVLDKVLPSIAYSVARDEGTRWTLEELHTYLVDGVTVGGHSVWEQAVVDGVRNAYKLLPELNSGIVRIEDACQLHSSLMQNLVRSSDMLGILRPVPVMLAGVPEWDPVPAASLSYVFDTEVELVNAIPNIIERAVVAMMWLQYRQFFVDGNKRVSRFMCNAILGSAKAGVFCIPSQHITEYQKLLADFYRTADATKIISYTLEHCLAYFPEQYDIHWPV